MVLEIMQSVNVENEEEYRKSLEERYPQTCPVCQPKVDKFLEDQESKFSYLNRYILMKDLTKSAPLRRSKNNRSVFLALRVLGFLHLLLMLIEIFHVYELARSFNSDSWDIKMTYFGEVELFLRETTTILLIAAASLFPFVLARCANIRKSEYMVLVRPNYLWDEVAVPLFYSATLIISILLSKSIASFGVIHFYMVILVNYDLTSRILTNFFDFIGLEKRLSITSYDHLRDKLIQNVNSKHNRLIFPQVKITLTQN